MIINQWLYLFLDVLLGLFAVLTIYSALFVTLIFLKKVPYNLPKWFENKWRLLVILNLIVCCFNLRLIHGHQDVFLICIITSASFIFFHIYLLFSIYTKNKIKQ